MPIRKGHMAHLRQSIFLRKPQGKGNPGRKNEAVENCAPHSRYFSDELGALIF